jgi:hypothetical protein
MAHVTRQLLPYREQRESSVHSLTITTVLGRLRQARTKVDRAASHRPPHRICGESTEQNRNKKPFSLTRCQDCVPDVHLYRRPNGTARIAFEPTRVPLGSTFTLHIIRVRRSTATRAVVSCTASRFTFRFFLCTSALRTLSLHLPVPLPLGTS